MNRPLLLVEDDIDDHEMMVYALAELGIQHPIKHFQDAEGALAYLRGTQESPFLIVSDMNMPKMNGLDFKAHIEACGDLKKRNIPFVFLSTTATDHYVSEAFLRNAQGYFVKGSSFDALKSTLKTILEYWTKTRRSN